MYALTQCARLYLHACWDVCVHSAPLSIYQDVTCSNSRGKADGEDDRWRRDRKPHILKAAKMKSSVACLLAGYEKLGIRCMAQNCSNIMLGMLSKTETSWCSIIPLACWVCTVVLTHNMQQLRTEIDDFMLANRNRRWQKTELCLPTVTFWSSGYIYSRTEGLV